MAQLARQLNEAQKRGVLAVLLQSRSLARSEQLKNLLNYLVEKEILGEGAALTEYQIGVDGLGLPKSYSPAEDSTVRNRVYTLRKKIEEIYRSELAQEAWRLEFPKGTYVPRYVEWQPEAGSERELVPPPLPSEAALEPIPASRSPWARFLLGMLTMGLLWLGSEWWQQMRRVPAIDPILREVWGPLLDPDANVLVCVATSPQMPVRSLPGQWKPQEGEPILEAPPNVVAWFKTMREIPSGHKVFLLPTNNSVGLGDALGASAVSKTLSLAGASFQVVPEKVVPLAAMRKRNVVLLGGSSDAQSVRHWLEKARFSIRFNPDTGDYSIFERGGAQRVFSARRNAKNQLVETYGMITMFPSEGSEGKQRTLAITSIYTAGNQAAMEFLTSPDSLRKFRSLLPEGKFPQAFQLLVKTSVDQMLPLSYEYATHVVLEP